MLSHDSGLMLLFHTITVYIEAISKNCTIATVDTVMGYVPMLLFLFVIENVVCDCILMQLTVTVIILAVPDLYFLLLMMMMMMSHDYVLMLLSHDYVL